jgi:hypothetical protein
MTMTNTVLLQVTIDHAVIREWARRRGTRPSSMDGHDHPWPLYLERGEISPGLVEIDWDTFFDEFEQAQLAFVYPVTGPGKDVDDTHELIKRASLPELSISGKSTIIERAM